MITYNIKLVSNFSSMEFSVTEADYEEYLDHLTEDDRIMTYEHFLEWTMKYANNILTSTVGGTIVNPRVTATKKIIPEDQKPSEKQIKWAENLGIENIDQYTKKELGELIKKMLAEQ